MYVKLHLFLDAISYFQLTGCKSSLNKANNLVLLQREVYRQKVRVIEFTLILDRQWGTLSIECYVHFLFFSYDFVITHTPQIFKLLCMSQFVGYSSLVACDSTWPNFAILTKGINILHIYTFWQNFSNLLL